MAECVCGSPTAISQAISKQSQAISKSIDSAGKYVDETLHGQAMGGSHGAPAPVRFCNWAAPEYGDIGENGWATAFRAAQLAIALLNASIQGQIADLKEDLADGYYQQAKYKWDRFNAKYRPLEEALLNEVSNAPVRNMDCADDRERARVAVDSAFDYVGGYLGGQAQSYRLCLSAVAVRQMEHSRALTMVDTENYNLRDDTWFMDFKNDQRWNRRSNVLNLGRNLGSLAMKYGDVARALSDDVSGIANKAASSLSMALGYYGSRFDTVFPTTYLSGSMSLVGTDSGMPGMSASGGYAI